MEHILTMANLKLKPSVFKPRPNVQSVIPTCWEIHDLFHPSTCQQLEERLIQRFRILMTGNLVCGPVDVW